MDGMANQLSQDDYCVLDTTQGRLTHGGPDARLGAMTVIASSVHVPTVDKRQRVADAAIAEVVDHIAAAFGPERIILFGSYAYGQPRPESDVDLLVIMETEQRETEQAVHILQTVEHHFGLDLIVRTPAKLARRLALGDPFLIEILDRGMVLYERPHA